MADRHNPFNLRPGVLPWNGQIGVDNGYCVFDSYFHGLRAGFKQLLAYQFYPERHGIEQITIRAIITTWAPPNENPTAAYIANVAKWTGWDADKILDLRDKDQLVTLGRAMLRQEQGKIDPWTVAQLGQAADAALVIQ